MTEEFKSGYEEQKRTALGLFAKCKADPESIKKLCEKHAELIQDFESVKELNRIMSLRFDEVTEKFPTPEELDLAITRLTEIYEDTEIKSRINQLMSFKKICVALYKDKFPVRQQSYDESVNSREVQND